MSDKHERDIVVVVMNFIQRHQYPQLEKKRENQFKLSQNDWRLSSNKKRESSIYIDTLDHHQKQRQRIEFLKRQENVNQIKYPDIQKNKKSIFNPKLITYRSPKYDQLKNVHLTYTRVSCQLQHHKRVSSNIDQHLLPLSIQRTYYQGYPFINKVEYDEFSNQPRSPDQEKFFRQMIHFSRRRTLQYQGKY